MATEKDTDLFARVEEGKIVEFPVYRLHIVNRAHPFSWYLPVQESEKPALPDFSRYEQTLTVYPDYVGAVYTVVPLTLAELLASIRRRPSFFTPGGTENPVPKYEEIDEALATHIKNEIANYGHAKLDEFAKTRGYNTLESLISYRGDPTASLATEAERGFLLRSQTWAALLGYFEAIQTDAKPVPTTLAEIDAVLPELTW